MSDVLSSPLSSRTLAPAGSKLVLAQWDAAGTSQGAQPQYQAPVHLHHEDDEAWYVLAGRLKVRIGDVECDVPAGAAAIGPHGVPHTFWNPDPAPARYVLVMSSQTNAMLDVLHNSGSLSAAEMGEIFARYGCALIG